MATPRTRRSTTATARTSGTRSPLALKPAAEETAPGIYERSVAPTSLTITNHTNAYGDRPTTAATMEVMETYYQCGERPIVASDLTVADSFYQSGERPVIASGLAISDTYSVFGSRPVASNYLGEATALMGYLD
jgi:hypothetical protein